MRILRGFLLLSLISTLGSCSLMVVRNIENELDPLNYKEEIAVLAEADAVPYDAVYVGEIKIGDNGFTTKCKYDDVMRKAREEARKNGGNVIKLVKHKKPSVFGSSCHQIKAHLYKVNDINKLDQLVEEEKLLDVDYAILNVYRYPGPGALIGYNLYLGDSVICRVQNNFKTTLHIKKEGLNTLRAKTESMSEIPVKFIKGKTYYLRCGIKMGAFVGRPELTLVDYKTGKVEFESFKAKNQ